VSQNVMIAWVIVEVDLYVDWD